MLRLPLPVERNSLIATSPDRVEAMNLPLYDLPSAGFFVIELFFSSRSSKRLPKRNRLTRPSFMSVASTPGSNSLRLQHSADFLLDAILNMTGSEIFTQSLKTSSA